MTDNRNEIDQQYKWDLSAIYATEEDFWKDFGEVQNLIRDFSKHEKTIMQGPQELYGALDDYFGALRRMMKLYEYASRNYDVDTSVNKYQAMEGKVGDLFNQFMASAYFVEPSVTKLPDETISQWFDAMPELARKYKRNIYMMRRYKPYMLSDEGEKLMAQLQAASGAASNIRSIFSNSDIRFGSIRDENGKKVEIRDANYIPFMMSQDRRVRKAAFTTLYKTYAQFANTYATMMNGAVKETTVTTKVRNFKDSLTASVYQDEITPVIYNTLIKTVRNNLDSLYEYYDLKRELLGVDKLHMYDVYPTIVKEFDRPYTYEEAVELTLSMAKIYGGEYYDTLSKGLKEKGWVDVYPNRGKRTGAYSAGSYDTEPYILLNFKGTFDDVSTLAHEAGHSMHSYFSRTYNMPHQSDYTLFVAEVASTVNELLLSENQMEKASSDIEKMFLLNETMERFKGTLFRQTMFAEFEKDIYAMVEKGEILTAEILNKHYYKIVKKYFGPRVVCDKQIACEWMRIPHFYYFFYVYKYATCISAAASIVRKMKEQGKPYIEKYIQFLKCGSSMSPLDSLKVADIDLSDPKVIEDAIDTFRQTVKQFKELALKNK